MASNAYPLKSNNFEKMNNTNQQDGSNEQVKNTLNVPEVRAIAQDLGITPAQVVISWHVQRGVSLIECQRGYTFTFFFLLSDRCFAKECHALSHCREFTK